jgi:DNA-binding winged helix-turn-helix (wHTH) protein
MATTYILGRFRLDAEASILFRGTEPVALGQRAVALLRALVEQPGIPVSKDALITAAWPGITVEESNLTVQISALRRVFGEEPGCEDWIETLPRRGYRFIGPVSVNDGGDTVGASQVSNVPTATGAPGLAPPIQPSIAVLPFQNMSGDPEQIYFSDGISEDIITELSRFRNLHVIARNSSFQYRDTAIDARRVARELGVQYLVEGSIGRLATVCAYRRSWSTRLWAITCGPTATIVRLTTSSQCRTRSCRASWPDSKADSPPALQSRPVASRRNIWEHMTVCFRLAHI